MILQAFIEFIGTFIFLFVILQQAQPIPIAIALLAVIYAFGSISGGHFNPAVSIMMNMHNQINITHMASYIIAQILGAIAALFFYQYIKKIKRN